MTFDSVNYFLMVVKLIATLVVCDLSFAFSPVSWIGSALLFMNQIDSLGVLNLNSGIDWHIRQMQRSTDISIITQSGSDQIYIYLDRVPHNRHSVTPKD
jgi:hypothetical protein